MLFIARDSMVVGPQTLLYNLDFEHKSPNRCIVMFSIGWKRVFLGLALSTLIIAGSAPCFAIDYGICGLWTTTISRPNGNITVDWKIESSGTYTVSSFGPGGKQSENGKISTEGNRYIKTTMIGPDNGTFQIIGPNKFSTNGRFGYTEWTRKGFGGAATAANPFPSVYGRNDSYQPRASSNNQAAFDQTRGYNPELNPRSKTWEKMGFGQAGTTKDQSGWTQRANSGQVANLQGSDLKSLLFSNFPLKGGQDEAEQFGLPALGKAASGPMRKRDFRLIQ